MEENEKIFKGFQTVETDHYICGCVQIYDFDNSKAHWKWVLCREHMLVVRHAIKDAEQDAKILAKIDAFKDFVMKIVNKFQKLFNINKSRS